MNATERTDITEPMEKNYKESGNEKELSCLAKMGIFALVIIVISVIVGWIVMKIRGWKNFIEMARQAEVGTFIGDHTGLYITLVIIGSIVSLIVFALLLKKND